MKDDFPELNRARVSVDEETRRGHLATISRALGERPARSPRMRLIAIAAATILLVPVMALASDRAVPGDFLYPVKQFLEPVIEVFDSDVAVRHRVEEVERLYQQDAPSEVIHEHIDVARDFVRESGLEDEVTHLRDRIERVHRDLAERDLTRDHDSSDREPSTDETPEGGTDSAPHPTRDTDR